MSEHGVPFERRSAQACSAIAERGSDRRLATALLTGMVASYALITWVIYFAVVAFG